MDVKRCLGTEVSSRFDRHRSDAFFYHMIMQQEHLGERLVNLITLGSFVYLIEQIPWSGD